MAVRFFFKDDEFNRTIDRMADESSRIDTEVLTGRVMSLLRKLVFHTRLAKFFFELAGRARAGWWPAWRKLGMSGTPYGVRPEALAMGEGSIVDRRDRKNKPYVTMTNEVPYIGRLEKRDGILKNAYSEAMRQMERALDRKYGKWLKMRSGR